ncbi:hypothetical protein BH23VER1_BH23VER1_23010 [soil metagenome]
MAAASFTFGLVQNAGWIKGGAISLPKILWLNFALTVFFVLPALLAFASRADARTRRLFAVVFASFAARAAVELYLIYATDHWRCAYGIAHNLITAALVLALWAPARGFAHLLLAALATESLMAYLFSRAADPAAGTFFAAPTEHFAPINSLTWIAVAAFYPWLLALVFRNRHHFRTRYA